MNNDVIRSVRYILNMNDKKLIEIFKLADFDLQLVDLNDMLLKDEDPNYIVCPDDVMAHFLDGLIYFKRGKDKDKPPVPFEFPISNNTILKKMRVAFELKEDDMHEIFDKAGFKIGRHELSAFLRRKGHENYRECGDQVLRYFLKGLTVRLRGSH
jgi:uncharacterized protein YehS (DUF1456 family)